MRWSTMRLTCAGLIVAALIVGGSCVSLPDEMMKDWDASQEELATARSELERLWKAQADHQRLQEEQRKQLTSKIRLADNASAERAERLAESIQMAEERIADAEDSPEIDELQGQVAQLKEERAAIDKKLQDQSTEFQALLEKQEQASGILSADVARAEDRHNEVVENIKAIKADALDYRSEFDEKIAKGLEKASGKVSEKLNATGYGSAGVLSALVLNGLATYFRRRNRDARA